MIKQLSYISTKALQIGLKQDVIILTNCSKRGTWNLKLFPDSTPKQLLLGMYVNITQARSREHTRTHSHIYRNV